MFTILVLIRNSDSAVAHVAVEFRLECTSLVPFIRTLDNELDIWMTDDVFMFVHRSIDKWVDI